MPWASNGFTIEQPLLERGTIVGTDGTDREHLSAAAREEHRFAERVAEHHRSIRDRCQFHSLSKIRAVEFRSRVHDILCEIDVLRSLVVALPMPQ